VNQYQSNGLEFDPQGRLVAVQNGRLTRYTQAGTVDSTLVLSGQNGVNFNQANDLSIGTNGAVYFTDLGTNVYHLSTGRVLSVVATGQQSANGVEWREEQNAVYVNNAVTNGLTRRFTAPAAGGALTAPATFASPVGTPDGATFDSHGNYYTASYSTGNIVVFNAAGVQLGTIALRHASGAYDGRAGVQGNASNCAFGGPNNTILYMTGDGGLYSLQMRIPGRVRPGTSVKPFALRPLRKQTAGGFDLRGRDVGAYIRKLPAIILISR
jgi:sugar lactone lactonase YvrE